MLTSDSNKDLIKMPTNYPGTIQSSSSQQCSLQHQLGLESKPLLFHDLCISWRASAQATLNLHQTFIQQSKKNIHKFCQQVQQSTPWILKYENCWPAKFYVFIYLHHKVRKGKKTNTLITQFYTHRAVAEPSPLKGAAIVGKGIPRHLRILSASDKAINNFLNSLWIPQPTLLPLLHSLGITSSWHLKAFANLTNQKKWLEDLVDQKKLNYVQHLVLHEGLNDLASTDHISTFQNPHTIYSVSAFLDLCHPRLTALLPHFTRLGVDSPTELKQFALDQRSGEILQGRLVEEGEMTLLELEILKEGFAKIADNRIKVKAPSQYNIQYDFNLW